MKITSDKIVEAMGGISDRLISEAAPGSGEIRGGFVRRITTTAAALVLISLAAVFAIMYTKTSGQISPTPGNTGATSTETETTSAAKDTANTDGSDTDVIGEPTKPSVTSFTFGSFYDDHDTGADITWERGEDGKVKILDIKALGGAESCSVLYSETVGTKVPLLIVDDSGTGKYYICDLEDGSGEKVFSGYYYTGSPPIFPHREFAVELCRMYGGCAYFILAGSENEEIGRTSYHIARFDADTGELKELNIDDRYLYFAETGGVDLFIEESPTGEVTGAFTPKELFGGEDEEHDVNYEGGTLTVDGAAVSGDSMIWHRNTKFDIGGETVTFDWTRTESGELEIRSSSENVLPKYRVSRYTYLVEVGGESLCLCDMRRGSTYSGMEKVFNKLGISPDDCELSAPDRWYEFGVTPFLIRSKEKTGTVGDDSYFFYSFAIINEVLFGPAVPDEGEFAGYDINRQLVSLHSLIGSRIRTEKKYDGYSAISWTVEFDNGENDSVPGAIVTVLLGKTPEDVIEGTGDIFKLKFRYERLALSDGDVFTNITE